MLFLLLQISMALSLCVDHTFNCTACEADTGCTYCSSASGGASSPLLFSPLLHAACLPSTIPCSDFAQGAQAVGEDDQCPLNKCAYGRSCSLCLAQSGDLPDAECGWCGERGEGAGGGGGACVERSQCTVGWLSGGEDTSQCDVQGGGADDTSDEIWPHFNGHWHQTDSMFGPVSLIVHGNSLLIVASSLGVSADLAPVRVVHSSNNPEDDSVVVAIPGMTCTGLPSGEAQAGEGDDLPEALVRVRVNGSSAERNEGLVISFYFNGCEERSPPSVEVAGSASEHFVKVYAHDQADPEPEPCVSSASDCNFPQGRCAGGECVCAVDWHGESCEEYRGTGSPTDLTLSCLDCANHHVECVALAADEQEECRCVIEAITCFREHAQCADEPAIVACEALAAGGVPCICPARTTTKATSASPASTWASTYSSTVAPGGDEQMSMRGGRSGSRGGSGNVLLILFLGCIIAAVLVCVAHFAHSRWSRARRVRTLSVEAASAAGGTTGHRSGGGGRRASSQQGTRLRGGGGGTRGHPGGYQDLDEDSTDDDILS